MLGFFCQAFLFVFMTKLNALELTCGDVHYMVKKSWLSSEVIVLDRNIERPYCVSESPAEKTTNLVVKDTEIWCVEKFYISMDRRPYAKSSKLLSFALNQVIEYDYVWQGGDWIKTDTRITKCLSEKKTRRQKIRDQK